MIHTHSTYREQHIYTRHFRYSFITVALLITVCTLLAGCLGTPSDSNTNSSPLSKIHLTVAGKKDNEAKILTKMYALLLQHAGFTVTELPELGGNAEVFNALITGKIDIYPEFTGDGLPKLGLSTTHDVQKDYQNIKEGYYTKYHITWLDIAPLNDTYGICTSKFIANQFNIKDISQVNNLSILSIATPPDASTDILDTVEKLYHLKFIRTQTNNEIETFPEVIKGRAQLNICYTTDPLIQTDNFVLLNDDQHAFLDYQPAPIVRNDTLRKAPQIAPVLNKLAPLLTSDVSTMLQAQVIAGFPITDVVTAWLKSQHLL